MDAMTQSKTEDAVGYGACIPAANSGHRFMGRGRRQVPRVNRKIEEEPAWMP